MAAGQLTAKRDTVVALLAAAALLMPGACSDPPAESRRARVSIGDRAFDLELAMDDAAQATGLSGRRHIDPDGGMLFVFNDSRVRSFWMKGCHVPIDLIFLDAAARVIAIHEMRPEPGVDDADLTSYGSRYAARYAVELAGGTAARLGLRHGQQIRLPGRLLKPRAD